LHSFCHASRLILPDGDVIGRRSARWYRDACIGERMAASFKVDPYVITDAPR
jgi:hypothetical protein